MKKFEYRWHNFATYPEILDWSNKIGKKGWELISIMDGKCFYKKETRLTLKK